MKCRTVILLLSAVSIAQDTAGFEEVEERWVWGPVDEPVTYSTVTKQSLQSITTESPAYDPCKVYNPPKPSFKAPGRRINEEKCEEYIYDFKLLKEQSKRYKECVAIRRKKNEKHSVTGGRRSFPGEFSHMGAIGWISVRGEYIFMCGSTLISPKFVMTAAHCIRAPPHSSIEDLDPKIIRLNDQNLFHVSHIGTKSDVNISRIIVHPQYKSPKKYFDIALMELAKDVSFKYKIKPACLWNKPDIGDFGNEVSVTGWGVLAQGSRHMSPDLQVANLDIIDSEQCDNLLENYRNRHWSGVTENQICAGRLEGGVDACQGDSGGPLQFRKPLFSYDHEKIYYVIGVTSFGIGCAYSNHPAIYTRVSSFIDWIEEYVWK